MIYLSDIRDWIREFGIGDNFSVGRINGDKDRSVGVYQRGTPARPVRAIGQMSSYEIKQVSVLIHWNKNADETEKAACELYKRLGAASPCTINGTKIYILQLLQSEPVNISTDDNGVYERVIEFDLYYERNDN